MPSRPLGSCGASFSSLGALKQELSTHGGELVDIKQLTVAGRRYSVGKNGKVTEKMSCWQKALRYLFGARAACGREKDIETALRQARNREAMGGGIFVPTPSSPSPSPVSSPMVMGTISPSSTILPSGVCTPAFTWRRLEDIPWADGDEIEAIEEDDESSWEVESPHESVECAATRTGASLQLARYYVQQIREEVKYLGAQVAALQEHIPLVDPVAERVNAANLAAQIVMVSNARLTVREALVKAEFAVGVAESAAQTAQEALVSLGAESGDDTVSYIVNRANASASAAEGAVGTARAAAEDAMTASAAVEAFALQITQF